MATKVLTIGSGSNGNCYMIESGGEVLMLEAGCKMSDIIRLSPFRFTEIVGCLVSHQHSDHFYKSTVKDLVKRGINIYVGNDVSFEVAGRGIFGLSDYENTPIGHFIVRTFKVPHNVPNYGFLITTPTKEKILFVTDAERCPVRADVDLVMMECNNDEDTIIDNLVNDEPGPGHPEFHMSLKDCTKACVANTSVHTKHIMLIHMSGSNVNESMAVDTIRQATNIENVTAAHQGLLIEIENDSF